MAVSVQLPLFESELHLPCNFKVYKLFVCIVSTSATALDLSVREGFEPHAVCWVAFVLMAPKHTDNLAVHGHCRLPFLKLLLSCAFAVKDYMNWAISGAFIAQSSL